MCIRANCNVAILIEPYDTQHYIVKYITKDELCSNAYRILMTSSMEDDEVKATQFLCKLIN
jgi:hypothetical protein